MLEGWLHTLRATGPPRLPLGQMQAPRAQASNEQELSTVGYVCCDKGPSTCHPRTCRSAACPCSSLHLPTAYLQPWRNCYWRKPAGEPVFPLVCRVWTAWPVVGKRGHTQIRCKAPERLAPRFAKGSLPQAQTVLTRPCSLMAPLRLGCGSSSWLLLRRRARAAGNPPAHECDGLPAMQSSESAWRYSPPSVGGRPALRQGLRLPPCTQGELTDVCLVATLRWAPPDPQGHARAHTPPEAIGCEAIAGSGPQLTTSV
eukprot:scaffold527_cov368-Prasinococcus_capsulatus_cf.AAC.35